MPEPDDEYLSQPEGFASLLALAGEGARTWLHVPACKYSTRRMPRNWRDSKYLRISTCYEAKLRGQGRWRSWRNNGQGFLEFEGSPFSEGRAENTGGLLIGFLALKLGSGARTLAWLNPSRWFPIVFTTPS